MNTDDCTTPPTPAPTARRQPENPDPAIRRPAPSSPRAAAVARLVPALLALLPLATVERVTRATADFLRALYGDDPVAVEDAHRRAVGDLGADALALPVYHALVAALLGSSPDVLVALRRDGVTTHPEDHLAHALGLVVLYRTRFTQPDPDAEVDAYALTRRAALRALVSLFPDAVRPARIAALEAWGHAVRAAYTLLVHGENTAGARETARTMLGDASTTLTETALDHGEDSLAEAIACAYFHEGVCCTRPIGPDDFGYVNMVHSAEALLDDLRAVRDVLPVPPAVESLRALRHARTEAKAHRVAHLVALMENAAASGRMPEAAALVEALPDLPVEGHHAEVAATMARAGSVALRVLSALPAVLDKEGVGLTERRNAARAMADQFGSALVFVGEEFKSLAVEMA